MKMLVQEACQGPVRDAFKANGDQLAQLTADALRPVVLRDFQVGPPVLPVLPCWPAGGSAGLRRRGHAVCRAATPL